MFWIRNCYKHKSINYLLAPSDIIIIIKRLKSYQDANSIAELNVLFARFLEQVITFYVNYYRSNYPEIRLIINKA